MAAAAVAIAFGIGIIAADIAGLLACITCSVLVILIATPFFKQRQRPVLAIIIVSFLIGAVRYAADKDIPPNDISCKTSQTKSFIGVIASDPETVPGRTRLEIRVESVKTDKGWIAATGRILTTAYSGERSTELDYGDRVLINARPYTPYDPTNPGQFSWKQYLARNGIYTCATVRNQNDIIILKRRAGNPATMLALQLKQHIITSVRQLHPPKQASLITGMTLGTYSCLNPETVTHFQRTGTLHLLAASGSNCFLLIMLFTPLLKQFGVQPKHRHIILVFLLVIYLMIVGAKPSLMRATIMASLVLLALPLGRTANIKNIFYIAAIIVLMIAPSDIFDVGFQLSFLGVWALICVSPLIQKVLEHFGWGQNNINTQNKKRISLALLYGKFKGIISGVLIGTIAVTIVTTPLIAYYFNYISLVALPANLALAAEVPFVFADGILSSTVAHIPELSYVFSLAGSFISNFLLETVGYFGSMRYSSISIPSPSITAIIGYYAILYVALSYIKSRIADE